MLGLIPNSSTSDNMRTDKPQLFQQMIMPWTVRMHEVIHDSIYRVVGSNLVVAPNLNKFAVEHMRDIS